IGAFLIEHFYTNFAAVDSPDAFNHAVGNLRVLLPGPLLPIAEASFIGVPIIFHAALGLYIAFTMRSNATSYPYLRNWFYLFQRTSGIFLLLYIALHVASMRFGFWELGGSSHLSVNDHAIDTVNTPFSIVHTDLAKPPILAFYILGVMSVAYHFSFGLWSF